MFIYQDPNDLEKLNICSFYYMKMGLEVEQRTWPVSAHLDYLISNFYLLYLAYSSIYAEKQAAGAAPSVNAETRDTLQELRQRLDEGSISVLPPSLRSQENAVCGIRSSLTRISALRVFKGLVGE